MICLLVKKTLEQKKKKENTGATVTYNHWVGPSETKSSCMNVLVVECPAEREMSGWSHVRDGIESLGCH